MCDAEADRSLVTRSSLLSRLRDLGDDTSWRDFFDTYWKLIYNAAIKAGLSHDEAQDVVQDTIIVISRRVQRFKYDPALGSFRGWLLHTTRWRILDHLRKRRPESVQRGPADDTLHGDAIDQIPDPASARIEAVWETEWKQNLFDAAIRCVKQKVRPKHFQAFELYAIQHQSSRQVTKTLGVSVPTVHLANHRIRNLIRQEVKRLEESGI